MTDAQCEEEQAAVGFLRSSAGQLLQQKQRTISVHESAVTHASEAGDVLVKPLKAAQGSVRSHDAA